MRKCGEWVVYGNSVTYLQQSILCHLHGQVHVFQCTMIGMSSVLYGRKSSFFPFEFSLSLYTNHSHVSVTFFALYVLPCVQCHE